MECRRELREPHAISILKSKGSKMEVDTDALSSIFRNPKIQDKPLCIVSISGAFRKGKSFMLNFFIRYLRQKGYENPHWMGEDDASMDEGFEWRGGRGACTNGILVWSEVFTVKKDGNEVAILLMDTQGLFDNKTDNKTNSIIFALSTLCSSVQIFNLTQQIQESDLGFLQFFTAYAQAARKESRSSDLKPFQSLLFLVRDWPHAEELEYGMSGGDAYLAEVLSDESTSEELSSVRNYLTSSFETTKCCLMPHPGRKVATTSNAFTGCLRDIDGDFLTHTKTFVDSLFHPKNLVIKTINGQVVSSLAIMQYIVDCSASLTDGKLPNPKTMMENVAEAQNYEAQKQCGEKYRQNMTEVLGDSFVEEDFLNLMHQQASMGAMQNFEELTRFGSEESRQKHRDYLQATIEREYGMLVQFNNSKQLEEETQILQVIQSIAGKYEGCMVESTKGDEFLPDGELEKIHENFVMQAYEQYSSHNSVTETLKDKYFDRLQNMIERVYDRVKSENTEKRRIAEEQNEIARCLMKLELECKMQYRNGMIEATAHYNDEMDLKHRNDVITREVLDHFDQKSLNIGATRESKLREEHLVSLKKKLNAEYKQMCEANKEKKVSLDKTLESQRSKACVVYEDTFRVLLKDSYMEKPDLRQKHLQVTGQLMDGLRSYTGARNMPPKIFNQHLQAAETMLNGKYSMIEKWNEKNNTFFRKCFKVAKDVIMPVVGIAVSLFTAFKRFF